MYIRHSRGRLHWAQEPARFAAIALTATGYPGLIIPPEFSYAYEFPSSCISLFHILWTDAIMFQATNEIVLLGAIQIHVVIFSSVSDIVQSKADFVKSKSQEWRGGSVALPHHITQPKLG